MRMSKNNQQSNKSIKSSTPLKEGIERRLESDTISEDVSLRGDTAKKSQVGNGIAVKVTNVSKTFKIPHKKIDSMKSAFVNFFKKNTYEEFYALKDISVEVKKGEFLGIIGHNGAGKSTLLKILAGVYQPTSGSIEVNGMISPFLELGIGFNPELSGRDNIYLNATVLGLTKKQIDKKFDEIVQFAELEKFIDEQLKNYSSGMKARLAFSVSIHADREILIMDEVLAVGDSRFQEKCLDIFKGYKDKGKTVILVTHSMATVREYCDRALLLHKGKLLGSGDVDEICDEYILKNMTESQKRGIEKKEKIEAQEKERVEKIKEGKCDRQQKKASDGVGENKIAEIVGIEVFDKNGNKLKKITEGDNFSVKVYVSVKEINKNISLAVQIFDTKNDYFVCGNNTFVNKFNCDWQIGKNTIEIKFEDVSLNFGVIYFKALLFKQQKEGIDNIIIDKFCDKENDNKYINIVRKEDKNGGGIMCIKHEWSRK